MVPWTTDTAREPARAAAPGAPRSRARLGRAGCVVPGAGGAHAAAYVLRQARRASHAEGAGDSGLARLIELHAFNAAGDAAVAISLAGTLFFQVPTGRGPQPGRAVPRADDAAVRGRRAADRPGPRPVQPRPPLGDRRHDGAAGVPLLGARQRGRRRVPRDVPRGARRAGRVQGVRRDARRRRAPGRPSDPRAGEGQLADLAGRHRRRRGLRTARGAAPRCRGRTGRCATRSWSSSAARSWRSCCRRRSTTPAGEETAQAERHHQGPGARASSSAGCAATAGCGCCPGSSRCSWRSCSATSRSPAGRTGPSCCSASSSAPPGSATRSASASGSMLRNVRPAVVVVLVLVADTVAAVVAALFYSLLTVALLGLTAGVSQALGQAVARLADPAGGAGAHPVERVRPLRDAAAAVLGGRRLPRDRAAADPPASGWASPRRCWSAITVWVLSDVRNRVSEEAQPPR